MNRLILSFLNAPLLILMVLIGVGMQTSLFTSYPLMYLQPDILLITVVWLALKRRFTEGGILTLILGNIAEIHSSSPQGLCLVSYMIVYLAVRSLAKLFVLPHFSTIIFVTIGASLLWKITNLIVLKFLGLAAHQWQHTLMFLFPGAAVQGMLGIWLYRSYEKFDLLTLKTDRSGDEIDLESEAF